MAKRKIESALWVMYGADVFGPPHGMTQSLRQIGLYRRWKEPRNFGNLQEDSCLGISEFCKKTD